MEANENWNAGNLIIHHEDDSDNVGMGKTIPPLSPEGCNLVTPLGATSTAISKNSPKQYR